MNWTRRSSGARQWTAAALSLAVAILVGRADSGPSAEAVTLRQNDEGSWRVFVGASEFPLRGAGGATAPGALEKLKQAGGNCVRTWSIDSLDVKDADGIRLIDRAQRLGLKVVAGLWVQHERHGFDYRDSNVVARQRSEIVAAVHRFKNHPAILLWGLGNEMEGPSSKAGSEVVLREVEELARLVKQEDPLHPVMTVIAFNPAKIEPVMRLCPSIDVLGVNSYGGAAGAGPELKAAGWKKPFAVTEFGVRGFWEVPATPWGAPWEPTSQEKARSYYSAHRLAFEMNEGKELCLGTFAFLWGWKQERTATWFGMLLPTSEKLPQVDVMTKAWTGAWPSNRCPLIERLVSDASGKVVKPGQPVTASVQVEDPDGDTLGYDWTIAAESTSTAEGGDQEAATATFPELVRTNNAAQCSFVTPATPGNYRVMLIVRDHHGSAATANFPFRVEP